VFSSPSLRNIVYICVQTLRAPEWAVFVGYCLLRFGCYTQTIVRWRQDTQVSDRPSKTGSAVTLSILLSRFWNQDNSPQLKTYHLNSKSKACQAPPFGSRK